MNWPTTLWGTRAVVAAGMGAKDRLREAVQLLSPDVQHRREYAHSGWRRIDEKWYYLTAGAVIGDQGAVDNVTVQLSGALTRLSLPVPPEAPDLAIAVRASLAILSRSGPDHRHRARCNLSRPAERGPCGGYGRTPERSNRRAEVRDRGALTAALRCGLRPPPSPRSWISTPNALERLLFEGKDALIGVDDFAPHGSQQDINRLHGTADVSSGVSATARDAGG